MNVIELPFKIGQVIKFRGEYYMICDGMTCKEPICKNCFFDGKECDSFPVDCRPSIEYPDGLIFKQMSEYEVLFQKGDDEE